MPAVARRRGRTVLWRVDDVLRRGLWRRTCALRAGEKGCLELAYSVCWSSLNAQNLPLLTQLRLNPICTARIVAPLPTVVTSHTETERMLL